jgi:hypothetical protein
MGMQCAYRNELQWFTARTCRSLSPFSFTVDGSWLDCAELQPTRRAFKCIEIQWLSLKTRGYSIMYPQNMWNGCDQFLTAKAFSTKGICLPSLNTLGLQFVTWTQYFLHLLMQLLKIPATIQAAITHTNCLHCSCVLGESYLYIRATVIHRSCFREDNIRFHRS